MLLKIIVGVIFWIMTLLLGYYAGIDEGRKK